MVIRIGRKRASAGLEDRLVGRQSAPALGVEREVDQHDAVLLDDADQQDDADEGDHRELAVGDLQRQQRAEARRGQGRDDGQRVRQALVEHAEHDIDRQQRREDQERLLADRFAHIPWRRRRSRRG